MISSLFPDIKIDREKECILINKFKEYRQFNVIWAERDPDGWINYREKYYNDVIVPLAINEKIVFRVDNDGSVSFTNDFTDYMTTVSTNKKKINPKFERDPAFVEYYTTSEIAKYLGLTYEAFYDLPVKEPTALKMIFDLGELVHRLINSDIYGHLAEEQDEMMKERAEFRKRVLRRER